jgi:glycine cleavage system H protein
MSDSEQTAGFRVDDTCLYTDTHDWVRVDGDIGTFGITDYAQSHLSSLVYVELPEVGSTFEKDAPYATVESSKATNESYAPMSGEVIEVNSALESNPGLVNEDPYGAGWLVRVRLSDPSEAAGLRSAASYLDLLRQLSEE